MSKDKTVKTNAMRMLDRMKIEYEVVTADITEFTSGEEMARLENVPAEESFKTLVMQGKSREYYVFVLPVEKEVDLKAAAASVGEKNIVMIPVKDITRVTGYVRGGCSPLGMKKLFVTRVAREAEAFEKIYVSAGKIGVSVRLRTEDLLRAVNAVYADFTA